MSTFTDRSIDEVRAIAQGFIDRNQPSDYRLVITEVYPSNGLQRYVVFVDTEPKEVRAMDFARRLAEIEGQMEDEGEDIMLHPALWQQD